MVLFVFQMKQLLTASFLLITLVCSAQQEGSKGKNTLISPEFMIGYLAPSNEFFPDRGLQTQYFISLARLQDDNPAEWAHRLKAPKTGISLGYTDFGNQGELGGGFTAMPFIEFNLFRSQRLKALVGMGATYFTKIFDPVTNPNNQGVSTEVLWSFRSFFNYELYERGRINWRVGLGYMHHSNGHTRLPNQGLNSFLLSLSADIYRAKTADTWSTQSFTDTRNHFISFRFGYGINALSGADPFNDKLPVYTIAGSYGKVYNKTWKLSAGFYYRFYQHYYNYITNNESLVQDGQEFASYRDNPWYNATVLGLSIAGEVLLNHVGLELELGWNIFKPGYDFDYRINEGWDNPPREIPDYWVLGEYDTKYHLKKAIASRMGLKYYLFGTDNNPVHNVYVGAHINANLGQADFTDVSLGYVYSFKFTEKDK